MSYQANLTVTISRQGRRYVAYAPALDISTSGKTETEAKKRFEELVQLFMEELEEAGTTAAVLTELGWTKQSAGRARSPWVPPVTKSAHVHVRIPAFA